MEIITKEESLVKVMSGVMTR